MTSRPEWFPVRSACDALKEARVPDPGGALRRALNLDHVRSRGVPATDDARIAAGDQPVPIEGAKWATWRFDFKRQSLDPRSPRRSIASGFAQVEISRADVEALADRLAAQSPPPAATAPARWTGTRDELVAAIKRHFVDAEAAGEPTNKPRSLAGLRAELGHIAEKEWNTAFAKAGVQSKGGRPPKTLAKP